MTAPARALPFATPRRRSTLRLAASNAWPLLRAEPPRIRTAPILADLLVAADAPREARFTTTAAGITIGIAHVPRPASLGTQAERLQQALLDRELQAASFWRRIAIRLWRWA